MTAVCSICGAHSGAACQNAGRPCPRPPSGVVARCRPPGPLKDCMTCRYWKPGTIVLRGSTQGECFQRDRMVGADEGCEMHEEKRAS